MRVSCNGCRVLRKGCSEDCTLRPSLAWIKNSDAQAHATLFLAKFYGRAGLLNLINAGPDHVRPAIFRSLLYEACGRIVNPVHGSLGLLWCGKWDQCEAAVDSVLKGLPIASQFMPPPDVPASIPCDIRHVHKTAENHNAAKTRTKAKRPAEASSSELVENKGVPVDKRPNMMKDGEVGLELSIGLPGVSFPEDAN